MIVVWCFCRGSLFGFIPLIRNVSPLSLLSIPTSFEQSSHGSWEHQASSCIVKSLNESMSRDCPPGFSFTRRYSMRESSGGFKRWQSVRHFSNAVVELKTDNNTVRFSFGCPSSTNGSRLKQKVAKTKMSKKAKLNELRFYRLKAKKKKTSPNPEVRIRYSLEKVRYYL